MHSFRYLSLFLFIVYTSGQIPTNYPTRSISYAPTIANSYTFDSYVTPTNYPIYIFPTPKPTLEITNNPTEQPTNPQLFLGCIPMRSIMPLSSDSYLISCGASPSINPLAGVCTMSIGFGIQQFNCSVLVTPPIFITCIFGVANQTTGDAKFYCDVIPDTYHLKRPTFDCDVLGKTGTLLCIIPSIPIIVPTISPTTYKPSFRHSLSPVNIPTIQQIVPTTSPTSPKPSFSPTDTPTIQPTNETNILLLPVIKVPRFTSDQIILLSFFSVSGGLFIIGFCVFAYYRDQELQSQRYMGA